MSGRAGRDGARRHGCTCSLAARDVCASASASSPRPRRRARETSWRSIAPCCVALIAPAAPISLDDEGIAREACALEPRVALDAPEVASGLAVFSELGFALRRGDGATPAGSPWPPRRSAWSSPSPCAIAEGLTRPAGLLRVSSAWALEADSGRASRPREPAHHARLRYHRVRRKEVEHMSANELHCRPRGARETPRGGVPERGELPPALEAACAAYLD